MSDRNLKIRQVTLVSPATFGNEALPLSSLMTYRSPAHVGTRVDGKSVEIVFDSDERFLRVEWGSLQGQLVPLSNVAGILYDLAAAEGAGQLLAKPAKAK